MVKSQPVGLLYIFITVALTCCHRCPNRQICGTPEAVCPNHRQGSRVNRELKTVGRMVQQIQWIKTKHWFPVGSFSSQLMLFLWVAKKCRVFYRFFLKRILGVTFGGNVCGWTPNNFEGVRFWGGPKLAKITVSLINSSTWCGMEKRLWWMCFSSWVTWDVGLQSHTYTHRTDFLQPAS